MVDFQEMESSRCIRKWMFFMRVYETIVRNEVYKCRICIKFLTEKKNAHKRKAPWILFRYAANYNTLLEYGLPIKQRRKRIDEHDDFQTKWLKWNGWQK